METQQITDLAALRGEIDNFLARHPDLDVPTFVRLAEDALKRRQTQTS